MLNQEEHNKVFYAAQNGNSDAFATLFDAYWDMAYYNCLKRLNNKQDAEDAAQEVFIILHRRIASMKGPEYLAKAIQFYTMEVCGGYVRKRKRIQFDQIISYEELGDRVAVQKDEFLPTAVLEHKELKAQILELIDNLPQKQRAVLLNYYFNDFSGKEISKMLGISLSAVGFNLHKARKKLAVLASEQMEIGRSAMTAAVPVLTQILREDMAQVATGGFKESIAFGLQEKLALGGIAQGSQAVGTSVAVGMGIGTKIIISTVALSASVGVVFGANNYYKASMPEKDVTSITAPVQNILADLRNVKNETDSAEFKHKWGFKYSSECSDETGTVYSVSSKVVDGTQYFIGHKKAVDSFLFVWEEVESNATAPDGLDIVTWVERLL